MRDFKQIYISKTLDYFAPGLIKRWGFDSYHDPNKPAMFFGIYSDYDMEILKNHKSYKILYFGGNDFRDKQISLVQKLKDIVCVGYGSDWLEKGANYFNLPFDRTMINTRTYDEFKPSPLGDKIYVYRGRLGTRPEYFKWDEIIVPIIEEFGKDRIIYAEDVDLITLRDEYYNKSFVYVKPNPRGGSTAMYELGLMGRKTITQEHSRFSNAIDYTSIDDIIAKIRVEESKIGTIQTNVSEEVRQLTIQDDSWLHLNYYDWKKLNNR